jgi:DNA transformation protein and related proteins
MAASDSFRTFVLEQLGRVVDHVRGRSMFGGVGIYARDLFFALIADDVLYLKVDAVNRPDFEARGRVPFRPLGERGETMQYYPLPDDVLDDVEALRPWVDKAIAAARRKQRRPPTRRGKGGADAPRP